MPTLFEGSNYPADDAPRTVAFNEGDVIGAVEPVEPAVGTPGTEHLHLSQGVEVSRRDLLQRVSQQAFTKGGRLSRRKPLPAKNPTDNSPEPR